MKDKLKMLALNLVTLGAALVAGSAWSAEPAPRVAPGSGIGPGFPTNPPPEVARRGQTPPSAPAQPPEKKESHVSLPQTKQVIETFMTRPGFRIQLVAAEPMISAPVAMAFDENGRLFVVERDDSPAREGSPHLGRVRRLENMDAEGVFQKSTILADDLPWPSAVACYAGGVFVAAYPNIIYLKDSKGDGVVDVNQTVLTGFGGTNAPSPRSLPNSFAWSLDQRIYGLTAGMGGTIMASNWPGGPVSLAGSDFSFDPLSLAVSAETGSAQSGLSFDISGRRFVTDYSRPLRQPMYEERYVRRNPFCAPAPALLDSASPATGIYQFVSTLPSQPGAPPRLRSQMTNGVVAGWMTAACGTVVYRGGAFPADYLDNIFVADPEAHAIHRMVLHEYGLQVLAERPPGEATTEFLLCRDASFRPAQVVNGPEGALYIADHQDDKDRGRIYRVLPVRFNPPKVPDLDSAPTRELVVMLAQSNSWQREAAARVLFERQDPTAVPLLINMLNFSRLPLARMEALHALAAQNALGEAQAIRGQQDTDPRVRQHALRLSEKLIKEGAVPEGLWEQFKALTADPVMSVRYQLAFTLGEVRRPEKARLLAEILSRAPSNVWVQGAVLSSVAEGAGDLFLILARDARFRNDPGGQDFLLRLVTTIGTRGRMDEVTQAANFITQGQLDAPQTFALLYGLGDGLRRTRSSLALVDSRGVLTPFYAQALNAAVNTLLPEALRVAALRFLSVSPYRYADVADWLMLIANPQPLPTLRAAAISMLGQFDEEGAMTSLLSLWPQLPPALRQQALAALLRRVSHVGPVLTALETGKIPAADLTSLQRDFLRTYPDPVLSERAVRLLGPVQTQRSAVLEQFRTAVELDGAPERGQRIFAARCAQCHELAGSGLACGPDLNGIRTRGKTEILRAIIEPNLDLAAAQAACVVQTREGENLVGIQADENAATITLRQPRGVRLVWPMLNVASIRPQTWSLMPADLEQGLTVQDMADLLQYLMSAPEVRFR